MHCAGLKGVCSASHQELEPPQGCGMRWFSGTRCCPMQQVGTVLPGCLASSFYHFGKFRLLELEASSLQWGQRLPNVLETSGTTSNNNKLWKSQQEITTALVNKNIKRMALAASSKNGFALVPPVAASSVNQACPASLKGVVLTWHWPFWEFDLLKVSTCNSPHCENAFRCLHVTNFSLWPPGKEASCPFCTCFPLLPFMIVKNVFSVLNFHAFPFVILHRNQFRWVRLPIKTNTAWKSM